MTEQSEMHARQKFLCVGLPNAGKTTFLVALYHVVESGEVSGSLELEKGKLFEADRDYIQSQREKWLLYTAVERNKTDAKGPILLSLIDAQRGQAVQLDIPDLSGEAFRGQVEDRVMSASFGDKLAECDGLLLFINPSKVVEPTTIVEADEALCRVEGEKAEADSPGTDDEDEDEDVDFPFEKHCTAVKLVELLQFFRPYLRAKPTTVAVVVSAFDVLAQTPFQDRPAHYVAQKLALVDQYLKSNPELFRYTVFGVSAQGAAYDNAQLVERIAGKGAAAERIQVHPTPPNGAHDITYVIRWLVTQLEEPQGVTRR